MNCWMSIPACTRLPKHHLLLGLPSFHAVTNSTDHASHFWGQIYFERFGLLTLGCSIWRAKMFVPSVVQSLVTLYGMVLPWLSAKNISFHLSSLRRFQTVV